MKCLVIPLVALTLSTYSHADDPIRWHHYQDSTRIMEARRKTHKDKLAKQEGGIKKKTDALRKQHLNRGDRVTKAHDARFDKWKRRHVSKYEKARANHKNKTDALRKQHRDKLLAFRAMLKAKMDRQRAFLKKN
jgi:hypothetical protein